jgi:hypothetical protein
VARLSAIVPATDAPATLEQCLEAIRTAAEGPEELIVVTEPPPAGPAAARNEGASRADGDVLVFVDADVLPHADAFRRIRAAFAADPGLAAVFGSYDDDPPAGVVAGFRNLLHHHVHQEGAGPVPTFWAGLGAIRRDVFLAAGGFDAERFPTASIEDVELGLRLSAVGERVELDPDVQGTHLKAWTLAEMVRTDFSRRGVPWVRLLADADGAGATALNLGWRHRASAAACVAGVAALVARRPAGAALALAALVGLNASFYRLLLRRRGPAEAVAGVGLHAIHHLTAVAAVPVGLAAHLSRERGR